MRDTRCEQIHRFHFNGVLFVCRRCGWWKRSPDDVPQAPPKTILEEVKR